MAMPGIPLEPSRSVSRAAARGSSVSVIRLAVASDGPVSCVLAWPAELAGRAPDHLAVAVYLRRTPVVALD